MNVVATDRLVPLLGELLLAISGPGPVEQILPRAGEILTRGLGFDGALACVREGDSLRVVRDDLTGARPGTPPLLPLAAHPWPEGTGSPFVVPAEALSGALGGLPARWRTFLCLPLPAEGSGQGALYLAGPPGHLGGPESRVLETVAVALGADLARRREEAELRKGIDGREAAVAVVAHDLRNPLNAISVGVGTLLPRITEPSLRRPVERIQRSAQRMERLLQDLLDIHAIESGRFTVTRGEVTGTALILTALDSQQALAGQTSVIINTDVSPELPPIDADQERVLQVLENLIGNALKFTPAGGVVTVGASRAAEPGWVLFWVKDTGPGIAPEHLPHIVDRFWQATARDRRGSGLGLAICKAIVEAHGGRIWAESPPGAGASLSFTSPCLQPASTRSAPVEPASILLLDDKVDNLTALQAILDRPDYRLITATHGEEALRLALRERFAVALIDVAMPVMNGFEVAQHLKALERSRHIPIIFITAFGDDPEEIHRAYAAGGADYLVKPLDPEIVRKKVAVFVELSRKRESEGLAPLEP